MVPEEYKSLYEFFAAMPLGIRLSPGMILFEWSGDSEAAFRAIAPHLHAEDSVTIFQICGGYWRYPDPKRDKQMAQFLLDTKPDQTS